MSVVKLETGSGKRVEVVCGAPNCRIDAFAAYIPPGGSIVSTKAGQDEGAALINVEVRSVQGVESCGVIASEAELGLSAEHEGVFLLEKSEYESGAYRRGGGKKALKAGVKLSEYLPAADTILEIDNKSLTPSAGFMVPFWICQRTLGNSRQTAAL